MIRFGLLIILLVAAPALAQSPGADAYDLLRQAEGTLKYPSPEQQAALETLQADPAGMIPGLTQDLIDFGSLSGPAQQRTANFFTGFLSPDQQLSVARAVAEESAEPPAVVLDVLARMGGTGDLPVVLTAIQRAPNGDGVGLARTLATREMPELMPQLEALSFSAPGVWADAVDLQLKRPPGTLRRDYQRRLQKSPDQKAPEE